MLQEELMDQPINVLMVDKPNSIHQKITGSWSRIAPFWPLKNLIAVNPIAGFEDMSFQTALKQANAYFQQPEMPPMMQEVNRQSIKWLQVFFDEGQATINMPLKKAGLLKSTRSLIRFDRKIHNNSTSKIKWLEQQPEQPETLIINALNYLEVEEQDQELFLTLLLTTLPGWAAYVQYDTNWTVNASHQQRPRVDQGEYLAFRLILTCLIWPEAKALLQWHQKALNVDTNQNNYRDILAAELTYQQHLLNQIKTTPPPSTTEKPDAQLVFCIDVRSEPFRRALEARGNYETFGFAGFFGVPVAIKDPYTGESYSSCPVLLKPAHEITEQPNCAAPQWKSGHGRLQGLKKLYQSLKYTFTTPFSLVETIGATCGLWMATRTLAPTASRRIQSTLKKTIAPDYSVIPDIATISIDQQVAYSAGILKMIGLTADFAPIVVFCGHGSSTENNAFATSLDCGACGGRHGAPNARVLAKMLNSEDVRAELKKQGIDIPNSTHFIAAEHNTTTDDVDIYADELPGMFAPNLIKLRDALGAAKNDNILWRSAQTGGHANIEHARKATALRATDWAEVRPEWGLARNACFIAGPRWLTQKSNLEGRAFLHSYRWEKDDNGSLLTAILTAPVVVAQWINAQYLFSTLDNRAFGAGSKVTTNITGKIGVMQGNASDLKHGLPLQSLFKSDKLPYHVPMRLSVVVYAPKTRIAQIVEQHETLTKLFTNGWVHMFCYDPNDGQKYRLNCNLSWSPVN